MKNNINELTLESIINVKIKVVDTLILIMALLIIPLLIKIIFFTNQSNINFRLIGQIIVISTLFIVNLKKKTFQLNTKGLILFSCLILAGFFAMFTYGVFSNGIILLMSGSILASIIIGKRTGIIFFIISFIITLLVAYGIALDFIQIESVLIEDIFSPLTLIPRIFQILLFMGAIIYILGKINEISANALKALSQKNMELESKLTAEK